MLPLLQLLAYQPGFPGPSDRELAAALSWMLVCILAIGVVAIVVMIPTIIGLWKLFEKAGKPGWAALIPIYNYFVLTEIAGLDILWFILTLVPCVNIVAIIVIWMNVAKNFGKSTGFAIGIILLPFVFVPLLGFSHARYTYQKH